MEEGPRWFDSQKLHTEQLDFGVPDSGEIATRVVAKWDANKDGQLSVGEIGDAVSTAGGVVH